MAFLVGAIFAAAAAGIGAAFLRATVIGGAHEREPGAALATAEAD